MTRISIILIAVALSVAAGTAAADSITFYQNDSFGGRNFTIDRPVADFSNNRFNDRARSAVVHEGHWEICIDADFRNGCSTIAPGAYPDLGEFAGRISSARPAETRRSENRLDERGRNWVARATLYEGANLSGRSMAVSDLLRDLGKTGFNDRASSLRVESGYWIFCSDSEFRGECRTFGPGDYAMLPGMNNTISSGRRISNSYPYGEHPDWQREPSRPSQTYQSRQ